MRPLTDPEAGLRIGGRMFHAVRLWIGRALS
jgi:hypothetical protein